MKLHTIILTSALACTLAACSTQKNEESMTKDVATDLSEDGKTYYFSIEGDFITA